MADPTNIYDVLKQLVQAAGAVGLVFLGSWVTTRSERRRETEKLKRDQGYALALLIAKLEQVALRCLEVANDTGEPDPDSGQMFYGVCAPEIDLFDEGLDLSKLPAEKLLELLELSHEKVRIERLIEGYREHDDWDELRDTLWVRREAYASLGRQVLRLAHGLRELGGLPRGAGEGQWSLDRDLEHSDALVKEERRKFEARAIGVAFDLEQAAIPSAPT